MTILGRNDKCACGSGRKYKQCCLQQDASKGGNKGAEPEHDVALALRSAFSHHQAGRLAEAAGIYRNILQRAPRHSEALHLLGLIAYQGGEYESAVDLINQAIAVDSSKSAYYYNLGIVLRTQGNYTAAVDCYYKALALKPDYVEVLYNLGNALQDLGNLDEAVSSYKKALKLKPDYVEAYYNLGNALQDQGNLSEAVASYKKTLKLQPTYVLALNNLGNAIKDQGRVDEALECYRQAFSIKPDYSDAHSNYLLAVHYLAKYEQSTILAMHRAFAEQFEAPLRQHWPRHENLPDPERRLRVGFVSGDFNAHPVAFFIEGLLTHLNRNALELVLYSTRSKTDEVTLRLQSLGYLWRSLVGVSDDDAAGLVREDGIDILFDLSGHTGHHRLQLFARKPAPIQVTWLGYADTTGLQAIDFILGDPYVLPPDEADYYVETPWRLPESYLCFTPPGEEVPIEELPAIRNGFITFGSFNNLAKVNDAVVALWARVLQAVPDSRLFLKTRQFTDPAVRQALVQRFSRHGIDAGRLILEGRSSTSEHFSAYNRMDIALDPFPFPGVTTSVDALWMGVPVLHLQGHGFIAHAGESILINVGLREWIAADADAYVRLATELTGNVQQLAGLRAGLREKLLASPLCDAPRFARNFEAALRGMWQQWCAKSKTSGRVPIEEP